MINKLRKNIFWIIQLSLTVIIIGIIIIFAGFSYRNTITSSTMFMDRIEGKEEIKNEPLNEFNQLKFDNNPFLVNIDGTYKLEINNNNVIKESKDVTDEIRNYAIKISNNNQEEGYIGNYIYKTRKVGNNGKEITLIENEDAIKRLRFTVMSTVMIGFVAIIGVCIISKKIAKTIVKLVE